MQVSLDFRNNSIILNSYDIQKNYTDREKLIKRATLILNRLKNLNLITARSRLNAISFHVFERLLSWEKLLYEKDEYCYLMIKYGNILLQTILG